MKGRSIIKRSIITLKTLLDSNCSSDNNNAEVVVPINLLINKHLDLIPTHGTEKEVYDCVILLCLTGYLLLIKFF